MDLYIIFTIYKNFTIYPYTFRYIFTVKQANNADKNKTKCVIQIPRDNYI